MSKDLSNLLDEFHYHEALDRSGVICDAIDRQLLQHPVCKLDKEVSKKVEESLNSLWEAYQILGSKNA
jgi:hypothetical protein